MKDGMKQERSKHHDIFEQNTNIQNVAKQHIANNQRRHSRDQKFLQFVVRLLTTDQNLSLYDHKNPENFVYIDKITSPIFQETRDQLRNILSLGLIRNLFVHMKGHQKYPFPQRTIVQRDPTQKHEQDIHQQALDEIQIQHLDVLDYPPLSFSDISLELLSHLFNHRSLNRFITQQNRSQKTRIWSSLYNGDLLLMFRLQQILQGDLYLKSSRMIFVDPLSLYVDGNHPLYLENKYRSQIQQQQMPYQNNMQIQQESLPLSYSYQNSKQPEYFDKEQQNTQLRQYIQQAAARLFQDDIRPFLMLLFQNYTFIPKTQDILHHPCLGIQHPLLLKWSMVPQHHIQYLLPLFKTYHALFHDRNITEEIIYQFSLLHCAGQRMQNIQNHRRNLAESLQIFGCIQKNQQRILQEPAFSRTAAEKIFLQQCEQYHVQDILIPNHQYCAEMLCSVLG